MKKFATISLAVSLLFTSTVFASDGVPAPVSESVKAQKVTKLLASSMADGQLNFKEIKSICAAAKGSNLNFVEKAALKVSKKKVAKNFENMYYAGGKSQLTAVLLAFFVGFLGVHRFYLGYTWQGVVQLLTLGGLGIWSLIDFIRILIGDLQPKDGEYEKTL